MTKKLLGLLILVLILLTRFVQVEAPQTLEPSPNPCTDPLVGQLDASLNYCAAFQKINETYIAQIKPIFQAKCLACHGNVEKIPLYSKIPPVSWLVLDDIEEAREHFNMSHDYPFYSKRRGVSPAKQFQELQETIEENEMPPWYYGTTHWRSGLNAQEKEKILNWIQESKKTLSIQ